MNTMVYGVSKASQRCPKPVSKVSQRETVEKSEFRCKPCSCSFYSDHAMTNFAIVFVGTRSEGLDTEQTKMAYFCSKMTSAMACSDVCEIEIWMLTGPSLSTIARASPVIL